MKLHGKIIISVIALTFSGHFSNLTARGPIDQHLIDEAMPMVDKAPDGFFVEAPYINNLIVMSVRVTNDQNEQVLYVRSRGEPVALLSADLAEGEYRYQIDTLFQLDEPQWQGTDFDDEGMSRENGRFYIIGGSLYEDPRQAYGDLPFNPDEASLFERLIQRAVNLAVMALDVLIPSV